MAAQSCTPGYHWGLIGLLSLCQLAEEGLWLPVITQLINLLHTAHDSQLQDTSPLT